MLKEIKWNMILSSVLYIALGVILTAMPATTARTICYLVAGVAIVLGVINLILYFLRDVQLNYYRNDFVTGLVFIILGIFVIYRVDLVISLVPFIIGLCIVISGFLKCQNALDIQRMGGQAVAVLAMALVNVVFGVLMVINPFESVVLLFRLLGAGLIFSGVTDLFATLYISKKVKDYRRKLQEADAAIKVTEIKEVSEDAEEQTGE